MVHVGPGFERLCKIAHNFIGSFVPYNFWVLVFPDTLGVAYEKNSRKNLDFRFSEKRQKGFQTRPNQRGSFFPQWEKIPPYGEIANLWVAQRAARESWNPVLL
jgi:hypothetical protein